MQLGTDLLTTTLQQMPIQENIFVNPPAVTSLADNATVDPPVYIDELPSTRGADVSIIQSFFLLAQPPD